LQDLLYKTGVVELLAQINKRKRKQNSNKRMYAFVIVLVFVFYFLVATGNK